MPFLITIGDNEFNDCVNANKARMLFRAVILGNPSLQQEVKGANHLFEPIRVRRQDEMIENVAWIFNNVEFIMLVFPSLPGDYPLNPDQINEILEADISFLKEGFNNAKMNKRHSVVLMMQADPASCKAHGCINFNNVLIEEVRAFGKPVLLINGDDHSREFKDGGYQGVPEWWRLRPGSDPASCWPEVSFSPLSQKFAVKWCDTP